MKINNDPAYLRDAQITNYELQLPPATVCDDGSEWRLVSYLAFDAAKAKKHFGRQPAFDAIAQKLVPLNPKSAEFAVGKTPLLIVYAQPYAPLLQTALRQFEQREPQWQNLLLGAGQLLVNLPAAALTYYFWKIDVVQFKRSEQAAAKSISRRCGIQYKWDELPPGHPSVPIPLAEGPSWRWWTKYFNE